MLCEPEKEPAVKPNSSFTLTGVISTNFFQILINFKEGGIESLKLSRKNFCVFARTFFAIMGPSSWSKRNIVNSERHFSNTKRSLCRHHPHPIVLEYNDVGNGEM